MPKLRNIMPSFGSVAPNSTASLSLPVNMDYANLMIKITSGAGDTPLTRTNMENLVGKVRVKYNSPAFGSLTLIDVNAKELLTLNEFYGLPFVNGILLLDFAKNYLTNLAMEDNFGLGCAEARSVFIEVELKSTITNPKMSAVATTFVRGKQEPMGQFVKLEVHHYNAAASAGLREIADLPVIGARLGLKALHISTDEILNYEVQANRVKLIEGEPSFDAVSNDLVAFRTGGRHQVTGWTHIDVMGNRYDDIVDTSKFADFRLKLQMTSAVDFQIVSETIIGGSLVA